MKVVPAQAGVIPNTELPKRSKKGRSRTSGGDPGILEKIRKGTGRSRTSGGDPVGSFIQNELE